MKSVLEQSTCHEGTYQYDQFNQTLATHENTYRETLSPDHFVRPSCESPTSDLCNESYGNNSNNIRPGNSVVQKTQVGTQSGECEVEGQEEYGDKIFNLFRELYGETSLVRADQSHQESAEDGVHSDDASKERRRKYHEYSQSYHGLGWPVVETASTLQDDHEDWSHGIHEEQDPCDAGEEDV